MMNYWKPNENIRKKSWWSLGMHNNAKPKFSRLIYRHEMLKKTYMIDQWRCSWFSLMWDDEKVFQIKWLQKNGDHFASSFINMFYLSFHEKDCWTKGGGCPLVQKNNNVQRGRIILSLNLDIIHAWNSYNQWVWVIHRN
jgi:hypothetical protein